MKIRGFQKVSNYDDAILPTRQTSASAGYDFCAYQDVIIKPQEVVMIPTGIKAYMLDDEVLEIYIRSSLACKTQVCLANNVGIIDSDYYNNENNEGHIFIPLYNFSNQNVIIKKEQRIAQGIFKKYLKIDDDNSVNKRSGGFGSTND